MVGVQKGLLCSVVDTVDTYHQLKQSETEQHKSVLASGDALHQYDKLKIHLVTLALNI